MAYSLYDPEHGSLHKTLVWEADKKIPPTGLGKLQGSIPSVQDHNWEKNNKQTQTSNKLKTPCLYTRVSIRPIVIVTKGA